MGLVVCLEHFWVGLLDVLLLHIQKSSVLILDLGAFNSFEREYWAYFCDFVGIDKRDHFEIWLRLGLFGLLLKILLLHFGDQRFFLFYYCKFLLFCLRRMLLYLSVFILVIHIIFFKPMSFLCFGLWLMAILKLFFFVFINKIDMTSIVL